MAGVTICSDFGAQENKICHCFHFFPSNCHEVMGPDAMILVFECWVLSQLFHSFSLIKMLFSSSLLSAIRVVSSAHLKLLIFLLAIFIPACESSSLAFCMMYSTYKLNKQGDNTQSWRTSLSILNHSIVPYPVLTVAFWPAYLLSQEAGKVVWYSHLFKNFPQFVVIYRVKGFSIVNEAELDIFLEFSCFFYDPPDVGDLISGSSPFLNPACTSGSSQFTYCWSLTWRILSMTLLAFEMNVILW